MKKRRSSPVAGEDSRIYFRTCRGGSAWWSVGLIGSCFDQTLLGNPEVTGSNPVPDTINVGESFLGKECIG